MQNETKKPCGPEAGGRDYNELGLYPHSEEENPTLGAAEALWSLLPAWMAARRIAVADRLYNKRLSAVIAENAEIILKAAKEMAEWEPEEFESDVIHQD